MEEAHGLWEQNVEQVWVVTEGGGWGDKVRGGAAGKAGAGRQDRKSGKDMQIQAGTLAGAWEPTWGSDLGMFQAEHIPEPLAECA